MRMDEFRFDPDISHLMPAHFGAAPLRSWIYAEVINVGISYRTDREPVSLYSRVLHSHQPVVGYAMNRGARRIDMTAVALTPFGF
jgi:hypothetical protein